MKVYFTFPIKFKVEGDLNVYIFYFLPLIKCFNPKYQNIYFSDYSFLLWYPM